MQKPRFEQLPLPPHRQSMGANQQEYRKSSNAWRDAIYGFVNTKLNSVLDWISFQNDEIESKKKSIEETYLKTNANKALLEDAIGKAHEISEIVIPEDATYSKKQIDEMNNELLTNQLYTMLYADLIRHKER